MIKRFFLNWLGNGGHKKKGFKFSLKKQLLLLSSIIAFLNPGILFLILLIVPASPLTSDQWLDFAKAVLIYYGALAPAMAVFYVAGKKIENGHDDFDPLQES